MTTINLLLVHKLQQYQVRVPVATTFAQLKVNAELERCATSKNQNSMF